MPNLTILRKDAPSRITVRPAVSDYLAATHRNRVTGSQENYAWRLYRFADFCDNAGISLEKIDASTIDAFLDAYEATARPRKQGATAISKVTIAGFVRVIRTFLAWCSRDRQMWGDFVEERTVKDIRMPKTPQVLIPVFDSQQIRALLEACEQEENARMIARGKAIVHLLIGTGLRAAECCHLTMSDVHAQDDHPYILVRCGKGARDRKIPLGPITLHKLNHWISLYRTTMPPAAPLPGTAPLFTTRAGEEAMTPATLGQVFERLGERAGIENCRCSPHTARHYFSCQCIKSGMSIYSLSKLLGHSSVVMTERYVRALGADFDELAEMVQGQLR